MARPDPLKPPSLLVFIRVQGSLLQLSVRLLQQLLRPLRMVSELIVPRRLRGIDLPFRGGDQTLRFRKVGMDLRIDVLLPDRHATCKQRCTAHPLDQTLLHAHGSLLWPLRNAEAAPQSLARAESIAERHKEAIKAATPRCSP